MRLTAAAFLALGFKVYWFKELLNHTPLVPFGIDKLGAACGVMITASHVTSLPTRIDLPRIQQWTMDIKCRSYSVFS